MANDEAGHSTGMRYGSGRFIAIQWVEKELMRLELRAPSWHGSYPLLELSLRLKISCHVTRDE